MREQQRETGVVQYASDYAGVSSEFIRRFNRILAARSARDALDAAIDALWEGIHPTSITVTERTDDGSFIIVDNYRNGAKWEHRIGEVVPDWGIAIAAAKSGRVVFRVTDEETVQQPQWFLYPYFMCAPVRSTLTGNEVVGAFAFGMANDDYFNEESAVVAGLVISAYEAARDGAARLDHGIEIGRAIAQERMVQRLHDTTVQEIFACECALELLLRAHRDDTALAPELGRVLDLLHTANRSLREVLAEARRSKASGPVCLDDVLERVMGIHRQQGGCPVAEVTEKGLLVPARVAEVAEGVLTEALANIRKHAHATGAVVACSALGETLAISVTDDGVGLARREAAPSQDGELHFGISNLRALVERAGGTFDVVSCEDGSGTIVRARIPLARDLGSVATNGEAAG